MSQRQRLGEPLLQLRRGRRGDGGVAQPPEVFPADPLKYYCLIVVASSISIITISSSSSSCSSISSSINKFPVDPLPRLQPIELDQRVAHGVELGDLAYAMLCHAMPCYAML